MEARDSCVFHQNWMDAAHTIEDKALRCYFYEAVLQYALTGMKMDVPPELKLVLTLIYGLIDKDKEKYERICERRREAGKKGAQTTNEKRWGSQSIANVDKSQQMSANVDKSQQMSHDTVTDTDTDTDTVTDTDKIINDLNKKNPPTPFGGIGGGGAKSFNDFFEAVRSIAVPKKVIDAEYENQYLWRMVDGNPGYGLEVSKAIKSCDSKDSFTEALRALNKKFAPSSDFQAVKLAMAMMKCKSQVVIKGVCAEVDAHHGEQGIYQVMLDKVEYINAGNKVNSIAGFLRSRKV